MINNYIVKVIGRYAVCAVRLKMCNVSDNMGFTNWLNMAKQIKLFFRTWNPICNRLQTAYIYSQIYESHSYCPKWHIHIVIAPKNFVTPFHFRFQWLWVITMTVQHVLTHTFWHWKCPDWLFVIYLIFD